MLKQTTPPALCPVSLGDAKRHLIVSHAEDDARIYEMVQAATRLLEDHTSRQLLTATWTLYADCFTPCIELRVCPVQSVESVKYIDADGEQQTLDPESYIVDTASEPARIVPAYGTVWPRTQRRINAVEVEFVAGYGEPHQVPRTAKQAVLLLTGHWYANREAVGTVGSEIALAYSSLIWSLKWCL